MLYRFWKLIQLLLPLYKNRLLKQLPLLELLFNAVKLKNLGVIPRTYDVLERFPYYRRVFRLQ